MGGYYSAQYQWHSFVCGGVLLFELLFSPLLRLVEIQPVAAECECQLIMTIMKSYIMSTKLIQ